MTPEQIAAIARAEAAMKPALDLYKHRCELWRNTMRLTLRDLMRLNFLLAQLSDDDLRATAAFAEGLAEWNAIGQSLSGGTDRQTEGETEGVSESIQHREDADGGQPTA